MLLFFDQPLKSRSTSYGVSLDVAWEVDLWGRLRNQKSAAAAGLQAAAGRAVSARFLEACREALAIGHRLLSSN